MKFYLGTHVVPWLSRANVPLFISYKQLKHRKKLPKSICSWALDSGAFSELSINHKWTISKEEYCDDVFRLKEEIGNLDWVSPQDWMCEPFIIEKTGKTVYQHQASTLRNFLFLREKLGDLVIPVLQGWKIEDYQSHIYMYELEGIKLSTEPVVGLGSVCRRQATSEIGAIVSSIKNKNINIHGFGVKSQGIGLYGKNLTSADSMAWSFKARRMKILLENCQGHINCANCFTYAMKWRQELLEKFEAVNG